jgi:zinc D-Ala-D-Ala carboxypeptidase
VTIYRTRIHKARVAAVLAVVVGIGFAYHSLASSSSTVESPIHLPRLKERVLPSAPPRSAVGEADSAIPAGTTVFDDGVAGVAKLDPDLLAALRRAATDAGNDGIQFYVDSGWRSPEYQEQLFQQAVAKYGSAAEASRWVAPPSKSAHVRGDAVDIGHSDAAAWLSAHGAAYGLCQIYANEPWHYELRPEAVDQGCPAMYADAAHDPRMQQ